MSFHIEQLKISRFIDKNAVSFDGKGITYSISNRGGRNGRV